MSNKDACRRLVLKFFKGDEKKTDLWFRTPNPLLGGKSPRSMIEGGSADKLLEWVEVQLAENEPPKPEETACRHGHEPWYDDPICIECVREDTRNAAFDMIARILDETAKNPKVDKITTVCELLKGIAGEVRRLKTELPPQGSVRTENPGSLDDMTALCPHCGGTGHIAARISDGTPYVLECIKCKKSIGGCIVGGDSPLQEVPAPRECPYCGGLAEYRKGVPDA